MKRLPEQLEGKLRELKKLSESQADGIISSHIVQHLAPDDSGYYAVIVRGRATKMNLIHSLGLHDESHIDDDMFNGLQRDKIYFIKMHQNTGEPWEVMIADHPFDQEPRLNSEGVRGLLKG